MVDHIDRDGLNNQKSNLRVCTNSQNSCNKIAHSDRRASKYKGIGHTKRNRTKKWSAKICVNGKQKGLGSFLTEREAAEAYNVAALKYHGEFANLNVLDSK